MKILLTLILSLLFTSPIWAYLTATKIAVTATSSSSGVPSTSQDSDVTDIVATGNVGIGSTNPHGSLDVPGTICFGHSCLSAWPAGGSQTTSTNMLFGNGSGAFTNVTGSGTTNGNVGIGSTNPGQKLDVGGTVRTTGLIIKTPPTTGLAFSTPYGPAPVQGLFSVSCITTSGAGGSVLCLSDSSSTPSTIVQQSSDSSLGISITCMAQISAGNYYEATSSGCNANEIGFYPN